MHGYWGEHYYNETIDQTVTYGLGRVFASNPLPETAEHTGLFQARYDDVSTPTLLIRPRLQNYAAEGFKYSPYVENIAETRPGG